MALSEGSWLTVSLRAYAFDPLRMLRTVRRTLNFTRSMSSTSHPPPVQGRNFKLALVQLGETSARKADNLKRARDLALKAAKGKNGDGDVDLIVLPECFNSLYGAGESCGTSRSPEFI